MRIVTCVEYCACRCKCIRDRSFWFVLLWRRGGSLRLQDFLIFFFKQNTAYDVRISDWSSDVCSSDLPTHFSVSIFRKNLVAGVNACLAQAFGNLLACVAQIGRQIVFLRTQRPALCLGGRAGLGADHDGDALADGAALVKTLPFLH